MCYTVIEVRNRVCSLKLITYSCTELKAKNFFVGIYIKTNNFKKESGLISFRMFLRLEATTQREIKSSSS
jgi:hypothetical protein